MEDRKGFIPLSIQEKKIFMPSSLEEYLKEKPRYSCFFVQRECPRFCSYCGSRDVRGRNLLNPDQWIKAMEVMDGLGVEFHLIIGNEILVYPKVEEFVKKLKEKEWGKYAVYSTFPEPYYSNLREKIAPHLYNMSCGVDIEAQDSGVIYDKHIRDKSIWGTEQLKWFKKQGVPDVQGTFTINRLNYPYINKVAETLTESEIWFGSSTIEWNKDGRYDFFSKNPKVSERMLFKPEDIEPLRRKMQEFADDVRAGRYMVQNPPEYFESVADNGWNMEWHCSKPLILNVEEDGSLRACTYFPGQDTRKFNIFEMENNPERYKEFLGDMYTDTTSCAGCHWSYWWISEFYANHQRLGKVLDKKYRGHFSEYWKGKEQFNLYGKDRVQLDKGELGV